MGNLIGMADNELRSPVFPGHADTFKGCETPVLCRDWFSNGAAFPLRTAAGVLAAGSSQIPKHAAAPQWI